MSKKKALIIIITVEIFVYLFLFVGFPLFKDWIYTQGLCTDGKDLLATPWPLYFIPGIIGVWILIAIWKQKEGGKGT